MEERKEFLTEKSTLERIVACLEESQDGEEFKFILMMFENPKILSNLHFVLDKAFFSRRFKSKESIHGLIGFVKGLIERNYNENKIIFQNLGNAIVEHITELWAANVPLELFISFFSLIIGVDLLMRKHEYIVKSVFIETFMKCSKVTKRVELLAAALHFLHSYITCFNAKTNYHGIFNNSFGFNTVELYSYQVDCGSIVCDKTERIDPTMLSSTSLVSRVISFFEQTTFKHEGVFKFSKKRSLHISEKPSSSTGNTAGTAAFLHENGPENIGDYCTFNITGRTYQYQPWFKCLTCSPNSDKGCCLFCARLCHGNHNVVFSRFSNFFCDCGACDSELSSASCSCQQPFSSIDKYTPPHADIPLYFDQKLIEQAIQTDGFLESLSVIVQTLSTTIQNFNFSLLEAAIPNSNTRHEAFIQYLSDNLRLNSSDIYWKDQKPVFDINLINYMTDEPPHFFFSRLQPYQVLSAAEKNSLAISVDGLSSSNVSDLLLSLDNSATVLQDIVNIRYKTEKKVLLGIQIHINPFDNQGLTGFLIPKSSRFIEIPHYSDHEKTVVSIILTPLEVLETLSTGCFTIQGLCGTLPSSVFALSIQLYFLDKSSFTFASYMSPVYVLEDQVLCDNVKQCVEYQLLRNSCSATDSLVRSTTLIIRLLPIMVERLNSQLLNVVNNSFKSLMQSSVTGLISQLHSFHVCQSDFDLSYLLKTSHIFCNSICQPSLVRAHSEMLLLLHTYLRGIQSFAFSKDYFLSCFTKSVTSPEFFNDIILITIKSAPSIIQFSGARLFVEKLLTAVFYNTLDSELCKSILLSALDDQPDVVQAHILLQLRQTVQDNYFWYSFLNEDALSVAQLAKHTRTPSDTDDFRCDSCESYPIENYRYYCSTCSDFDLCTKCFPPNRVHHSGNHVFSLLLIGEQHSPSNIKWKYRREIASNVLSSFTNLPLIQQSKLSNSKDALTNGFQFAKPLLLAKLLLVMKASYSGIAQFLSFLKVFLEETKIGQKLDLSLEIYDIFARFTGRVFKILNKVKSSKSKKSALLEEESATLSFLLEVLAKLLSRCFLGEDVSLMDARTPVRLTNYHPIMDLFWTTNFYPKSEVQLQKAYAGGLPESCANSQQFGKVLLIALKYVLSFTDQFGCLHMIDSKTREQVHDICVQVIVKDYSKILVENARLCLQSLGLSKEDICNECSVFAFKKCFSNISAAIESSESVVDSLIRLRCEGIKKLECFTQFCFEQTTIEVGVVRPHIDLLVSLLLRYPKEHSVVNNVFRILFLVVHTCESLTLQSFFANFINKDKLFNFIISQVFTHTAKSIREETCALLFLLHEKKLYTTEFILHALAKESHFFDRRIQTSCLLQCSMLMSCLLKEQTNLDDKLSTDVYAGLVSRLEECVRVVGDNVHFNSDGSGIAKHINSRPCQECWAMQPEYKYLKLDSIKKSSKFTATTMTYELNHLFQVRGVELSIQPLLSKHLGSDQLLFHSNGDSENQSIGLQKIILFSDKSDKISSQKTSTPWRKLGEIDFCKETVPTGKSNKRPQKHERKLQLKLSVPTHCQVLRVEFIFSNSSKRRGPREFVCPRCEAKVTDAERGICQSCGEVAFQCRICRNINYENINAFLCVDCGHCRYAKFSFALEASKSYYQPTIRSKSSFEVAEAKYTEVRKKSRVLTANFEKAFSLADKNAKDGLKSYFMIDHKNLESVYNRLANLQNENIRERSHLKGLTSRLNPENLSALVSSFGDDSLYSFLENRGTTISEQLDRIRNYQRRRKTIIEAKRKTSDDSKLVQDKLEKSFLELREVCSQLYFLEKKLIEYTNRKMALRPDCITCETKLAILITSVLCCMLKLSSGVRAHKPLVTLVLKNGWLCHPLQIQEDIINFKVRGKDISIGDGSVLVANLFVNEDIGTLIATQTKASIDDLLQHKREISKFNIVAILTILKASITQSQYKCGDFKLKTIKETVRLLFSKLLSSEHSVASIAVKSPCVLQNMCSTASYILRSSVKKQNLSKLGAEIFEFAKILIFGRHEESSSNLRGLLCSWRFRLKESLSKCAYYNKHTIFAILEMYNAVLYYVEHSAIAFKEKVYSEFLETFLVSFCLIELKHKSDHSKLEGLCLQVIILVAHISKLGSLGQYYTLSIQKLILQILKRCQLELESLHNNDLKRGSQVNGLTYYEIQSFAIEWIRTALIILYALLPTHIKHIELTRLSKELQYMICDINYKIVVLGQIDDSIHSLAEIVTQACLRSVKESDKVQLLSKVITRLDLCTMDDTVKVRLFERCLSDLLSVNLAESPEADFKIFMQRSVAQEIYFRGALSKNPITLSSLSQLSGEDKPTIKNIISFILKELDFADDGLMEILVCDKIVAQDLYVEDVYKHLWLKHVDDTNSESDFYDDELDEDDDYVEEEEGEDSAYLGWNQDMSSSNLIANQLKQGEDIEAKRSAHALSSLVNNTDLNQITMFLSNTIKIGYQIEAFNSPVEHQSRAMIIVYRIRGVDGEATEDYIENISSGTETSKENHIVLKDEALHKVIQVQKFATEMLRDGGQFDKLLLQNVTQNVLKLLEVVHNNSLELLKKDKMLFEAIFQVIEDHVQSKESCSLAFQASVVLDRLLCNLTEQNVEFDSKSISGKGYEMYFLLFSRFSNYYHILEERDHLKSLARVAIRLISLNSQVWHEMSAHIMEVVNSAFLDVNNNSKYTRNQLEILFFGLTGQDSNISHLLLKEKITHTCLNKAKDMLSLVAKNKGKESSLHLSKLQDIDLLLQFVGVAVEGSVEAQNLLKSSGVLKLIFNIEKLPNSKCSVRYRSNQAVKTVDTPSYFRLNEICNVLLIDLQARNEVIAETIKNWDELLKRKKLKKAKKRRKEAQSEIFKSVKKRKSLSGSSWLNELHALDDGEGPSCLICFEGRSFRPNLVMGVYVFTKPIGADDYFTLFSSLYSGATTQSKEALTIFNSYCHGTSVSSFNIVHFGCHDQAVKVDKSQVMVKARKSEWEGAQIRNGHVLCNNLMPLTGSVGQRAAKEDYEAAVCKYLNVLIKGVLSLGDDLEVTSISTVKIGKTVYNASGAFFLLFCFDIKSLLLRLSFREDLTADAKGGGREDNFKLLTPLFQLATLLYEKIAEDQFVADGGMLGALQEILNDNDKASFNETSESIPLIYVVFLFCSSKKSWQEHKKKLIEKLEWFAESTARNAMIQGFLQGSGALKRKRARSASLVSNVDSVIDAEPPIEINESTRKQSLQASYRFFALLNKLFMFIDSYGAPTNAKGLKKWLENEEKTINDCIQLAKFDKSLSEINDVQEFKKYF